VNRAIGPGAVTVAVIDFEWTRLPLVPVIVTVYEPAFAVVMVQVDVWLPLMLEGTQVVVTPEGADAVVRATAPVKPPLAVMLIVDIADWPPANDTLVGFAARAKSGAVTVAAIVAVWTSAPLVPVIVTV